MLSPQQQRTQHPLRRLPLAWRQRLEVGQLPLGYGEGQPMVFGGL
jgi:hypothetical protein